VFEVKAQWKWGRTRIEFFNPLLSFVNAQGSFGTTVGVILVDMQNLLARARESTLSKEAASVRQAL